MAEHKVAEAVLAIPCWGIYADYDANAPDTATCFLVATEELAKEVCALLNESPRSYGNLAFVDGWEHCKSFSYSGEFCAVNMVGRIFTSLDALKASEHLEREDDDAEESDED